MQPEDDPDFAWVAGLADVPARRAREAVRGARDERALYRHLDRMHRAGGRSSYIEIDAPLELYALVRLLRPSHVVEVGVSSGVSSAYLLQALERNEHGTLHSVDLPKPPRRARDGSWSRHASWALPPGRASGWAVPLPLRRRWDLRLGDKKNVLPLFGEELSKVELFVYDVPHSEEQAAVDFAAIDPLCRTGAVAIADHGPGGGLCAPLARWAKARSARPLRRSGLGLFGFRCGPRGRHGPDPSQRRRLHVQPRRRARP